MELLFITLLLISGIWIIALSQKYGYFTYSTAGYYNKSVIQHRIKENLTYYHHPATYDGLKPLPNSTAFNAHEELSYYFQGEDALNYAVKDQLKGYAILFVKNGGRLLILILPFFTLLAFPILISITWKLFKLRENWYQYPLFKIAIFSILYPLGYLFFFMKIRYVWILQIVLVLFGLVLLKTVIERFKLNKFQKYSLSLVFIFSAIYGTTFKQPHDFPYAEMNPIIENLKIPKNSHIASADFWTYYMELLYNLDFKIFGNSYKSLSNRRGVSTRLK